jgi:uncharacterized protein
MKLQPDKPGLQSVTAYGPGWVSLQGEKITGSVVIGSRGERLAWNCSDFQALTMHHFEAIAQFEPELLIFGSGKTLTFPDPSWLGSLISRRIGIETMDTQAACRTYNILAAEGRHVVAALLLEES